VSAGQEDNNWHSLCCWILVMGLGSLGLDTSFLHLGFLVSCWFDMSTGSVSSLYGLLHCNTMNHTCTHCFFRVRVVCPCGSSTDIRFTGFYYFKECAWNFYAMEESQTQACSLIHVCSDGHHNSLGCLEKLAQSLSDLVASHQQSILCIQVEGCRLTENKRSPKR
jgi:hypothetical protein